MAARSAVAFGGEVGGVKVQRRDDAREAAAREAVQKHASVTTVAEGQGRATVFVGGAAHEIPAGRLLRALAAGRQLFGGHGSSSAPSILASVEQATTRRPDTRMVGSEPFWAARYEADRDNPRQ